MNHTAYLFDQFFTDKTLRIDFLHTGNSAKETVKINELYGYGIWAGSKKNLIDPLDSGSYCAKIYDRQSGTLIFSRNFDTLLKIYRTTGPAIKGQEEIFHESVLIPFPQKTIEFALEKRGDANIFKEFFRTGIDPLSAAAPSLDPDVLVFKVHEGGNPHQAVDIAVVGDGYTKDNIGKFTLDLDRFVEVFFKHEPFASNKKKFNIYGVLKVSADEGVSEPGAGILKNTALGVTFDTFGAERFLTTRDNKTLRDIAGHVPYDALCVMVNHKRYGGAGMYNKYCTLTSDNPWFEYLVIHEFGHSFAGLADEYYTSKNVFDHFYQKGVEPIEPNITTLLEPPNLKWKQLVDNGSSVPTPWEKEAYEKMDLAWQQKREQLNEQIARLKKTGASKALIDASEREYEERDMAHTRKAGVFLSGAKNSGKVGAFEGAGYLSKSLYRPEVGCVMFSKSIDRYCKVCQSTIQRAIFYYTK